MVGRADEGERKGWEGGRGAGAEVVRYPYGPPSSGPRWQAQSPLARTLAWSGGNSAALPGWVVSYGENPNVSSGSTWVHHRTPQNKTKQRTGV